MPREPNLSETMFAETSNPAELGAAPDCRPPRAAERLSRTANRLFYRHGIRAVGVEEIVTSAGVTKPSLYRSFSSKDDLIVACLRGRFERIALWWDELEQRIPGNPVAQTQALIAEIAAEAASPDYRGCAVTNAAMEFPEPGHPVRMIAEAQKTALRSRFRALVDRLPTDRPDLLSDSLILLFEGARASRHTSDGRGPSAALKDAAEALLRAFLTTASSSTPDSILGRVSSSD